MFTLGITFEPRNRIQITTCPIIFVQMNAAAGQQPSAASASPE